jgi:hypothetical protein
LTYIAWGREAGTQSRLFSLAIAIACEMHLNKALPPDAHMLTELGLFPDADFVCMKDGIGQSGPVLEPQRAVLACFLLSSV